MNDHAPQTAHDPTDRRITADPIDASAVSVGETTEVTDEVLDWLAHRAARGDDVAFDRLVRLIDNAGLIRGPVLRVVLDPDLVDDVCQDVWVTLADKIGTWHGHSSFATWLWTVARNQASQHVRATTSATTTIGLPEDTISVGRRISSLLTTRQIVRDAVAALPETYRIPVVLRDLEHVDYARIAAHLGISEDNARARVSRGRRMVRQRLNGLQS